MGAGLGGERWEGALLDEVWVCVDACLEADKMFSWEV